LNKFYNIEGIKEYNIDPKSWDNRKPGLSAMVRLRNEEEFIKPCIDSIIEWFDEIVCTLQCSTDATEDILKSFNSNKIKIYRYPFMSIPNGPCHAKQKRNSIFERAYFYNWSLSLTTRQWVSKWDGDMVAHDWLGDEVHKLINADKYDIICVGGINLVGDMKYISKMKAKAANEPRFFRIMPNVYYFTDSMCEDIHHPKYRRGMGFSNSLIKDGHRTFKINDPGYLHFKWVKTIESAIMAWPQNWKEIEHFKSIYDYRQPGRRYKGPIPVALKGVM